MICERCRGTGFEIVEKDGREFAVKCACRKTTGSVESGDALLRACRLPPRYEHCTLADFEPSNPSLRSALEKAMSYCAGYPHLGHDEGLGLLLTGDNGVGKTHLAVAVLRELVGSKGASGQFWDFHELIREIRNSYDQETKTTELQVLEPVVSVDILVLDDLGAWKMTDWMVDTLFYILNGRYMEKRATLITTNFQDAPPEAAQKGDAFRRSEFLVDRIGQRLRSRLQEMCLVINIQAPDRREGRQIAHRLAIGSGLAPPPRKG